MATPTHEKHQALKNQDEGYQLARNDAVRYLSGRKPAVVSVARRYHLDADELAQEGYEVLLTCLRDYTPIVQKSDGSEVSVQFNTFFGNRLEVRAMEMRNRDPEYQARQAITEGMSEEEKTHFKEDPPLLVQHLDYENTLQQTLKGEVSQAYSNQNDNKTLRILRDSFFDQKLSELVAQEQDEKKQAALLHVKMGGVYNFKEIAYHFGVTDSRASQVMNELMDAFYVQRLIDQDLKAVLTDFEKLKFAEKRIERLVGEALQFVDDARSATILTLFKEHLKNPQELRKKAQRKAVEAQQRAEITKNKLKDTPIVPPPPAYDKVFTLQEHKSFPLAEVGMRPLNTLKEIDDLDFRPRESAEFFQKFLDAFDINDPHYPALVAEDGTIIDGALRVRAAKAKGRKEYLCLTIKVPQKEEQRRLRVVVNMRLHSSSKIEMFYAISALSGLGFSQQKIADNLDTGRTNVLVYCKVKDRATPPLRALFEDELIQITNAATCAELDDVDQLKITHFIRKYGKNWSKGKDFNKLFKAVAEGTLDKLEKTLPEDVRKKVAPFPLDPNPAQPHSTDAVAQRRLSALEKQLNTYALALKDQEIWAAQREGVINQQREELTDLRGELEALRRETEAAELIKFGDPKALDAEIKHIRAFFTVVERVAAAAKGVEQARKDLRRLDLRRSQASELATLLEEIEKAVNALRVEIHNNCRWREKPTPPSSTGQ